MLVSVIPGDTLTSRKCTSPDSLTIRSVREISRRPRAECAQVAAETIATDNGGSYALVTPALLNTYESTIQVGSTPAGNAYIANVNTTGGAVGTSTTYTVTATSTSGDAYGISRAANGTIARTCLPVSQGGCSSSGTW